MSSVKGKGSSYGGISSSSLASLTAEISKQKEARTKGSAPVKKSTTKKLPLWAKKNAGVAARQAKDEAVYEADVPGPGAGNDSIRSRAMLEKKAQLYDKIKRGQSGGLSEGKIQSLLVDFDRKNYDNPDDSASSSESASSDDDDDEDSRPALPARAGPSSDPLVEYIDDFGRTRLVPRSELPRGAPVQPEPVADSSANVLYGDQHTFPVYEPDADVLAVKKAALAEHEPLIAHFDGSAEIRNKGAGFYQFSLDEEERKRQMDDLKRRRDTTERTREENLGKDEVEEGKKRDREEEQREIAERRDEFERKRTAAKVGFVEERNPKFARAE